MSSVAMDRGVLAMAPIVPQLQAESLDSIEQAVQCRLICNRAGENRLDRLDRHERRGSDGHDHADERPPAVADRTFLSLE